MSFVGGGVLTGPSSATKPTNVAIGTLFFETDTGKLYIFRGGTWQYLVQSSDIPPPGMAFLGSTTFTASGTYTTPSGAKLLVVIASGGGGGGAGGSDISGGGGGSLFSLFVPNPASSYAITIGAGGSGSNGAGTQGAQGGTSAMGTINFPGGRGGGCQMLYSTYYGPGGSGAGMGGDGGSVFRVASTAAYVWQNGMSTPYGTGGSGTGSSSGPAGGGGGAGYGNGGNAGTSPGSGTYGGGGGAGINATGGAGGSGIVIIYAYG